MYPAVHAGRTPDRAAVVMAGSGATQTYRELDEGSNRLAQYLRAAGLRRGDHVAIMLENHLRYFEVVWAAQRSGLVYTPINVHLKPDEAAYLVADSGARALITSYAQRGTAAALVAEDAGAVEVRLMLDGAIDGFLDYEAAVGTSPAEPVDDECEGVDMVYSSGTTGRPKGVMPRWKDLPVGTPPALVGIMERLYGFGDETVYLSPAPTYHAAPLRFSLGVQRLGGTVVVMERFDPAGAVRALERYSVTHSQWVPTMFIRMLRLDDAERFGHDLSAHRVAIHSAAPCPADVKEQMIEWWGPIIYEYYSGSEGNVFVAIDSHEWLTHRGSVGRAVFGELHILDEEGNDLPPGEVGAIYVARSGRFEYHNDPEKTAASRNPKGWTTLGDVGWLDAEGFLYLADRRSDLIISGGVNIYPQEVENILAMHPAVHDCAVIGVPDPDFGQRVRAVVELGPGVEATEDLASELQAFCRERLAGFKCPREIVFEAELPRTETGKLSRQGLRDRRAT